MTRPFFILTILIFTNLFAFGQTTDSIKIKIAGTWNITKHVFPPKEKPFAEFTSDTKSIYEFNKDGTYKLTFTEKYEGNPSTIVTVGKWRISSDKKNISLFQNKYLPPNDNSGSCGDHDLIIVKLTNAEFITKEYIYTEGKPGTSYYKKQ